MGQTHLPGHWINKLRVLLEAPNTHEVVRFFTAWAQAEGGNARWNPLNTTLALKGSVDWDEPTDYNTIGVKNYRYAIVGVVATALTLNQRKADGTLLFGTLLQNLRNESLTAEQIVNASSADIKTWGTNPQVILDVLKSTP